MTDQIRADTRPTVPTGGTGPTTDTGDPVATDIRTTDALKSAIDGGAGGDKTPAVDLSMSPLGTDDEVAGSGNTPQQVRMAAAQEIRPQVAHAPNRQRPGVDGGMIAIAALIVALIGVAVFLV